MTTTLQKSTDFKGTSYPQGYSPILHCCIEELRLTEWQMETIARGLINEHLFAHPWKLIEILSEDESEEFESVEYFIEPRLFFGAKIWDMQTLPIWVKRMVWQKPLSGEYGDPQNYVDSEPEFDTIYLGNDPKVCMDFDTEPITNWIFLMLEWVILHRDEPEFFNAAYLAYEKTLSK